MLLHRFGAGREPLLPQGLKPTCKENEKSVPGCSKPMYSATKKKKKDGGFGENHGDIEGKQPAPTAGSAGQLQEKPPQRSSGEGTSSYRSRFLSRGPRGAAAAGYERPLGPGHGGVEKQGFPRPKRVKPVFSRGWTPGAGFPGCQGAVPVPWGRRFAAGHAPPPPPRTAPGGEYQTPGGGTRDRDPRPPPLPHSPSSTAGNLRGWRQAAENQEKAEPPPASPRRPRPWAAPAALLRPCGSVREGPPAVTAPSVQAAEGEGGDTEARSSAKQEPKVPERIGSGAGAAAAGAPERAGPPPSPPRLDGNLYGARRRPAGLMVLWKTSRSPANQQAGEAKCRLPWLSSAPQPCSGAVPGLWPDQLQCLFSAGLRFRLYSQLVFPMGS
ncbi:uncharacterized protein LOC104328524 [Opisthocomus hoazin]|uniref:uncharacterized protein LOC104328524 n=1 Tax=Opisthocomus hoazin TaxID=30419 RepID=UPI003F535460